MRELLLIVPSRNGRSTEGTSDRRSSADLDGTRIGDRPDRCVLCALPLPLTLGGKAKELGCEASSWLGGKLLAFDRAPLEGGGASRRHRLRVSHRLRRAPRGGGRTWEREGRDPDTLRFSLTTGCLIGADRDELHDRARRLASRRERSPATPPPTSTRYGTSSLLTSPVGASPSCAWAVSWICSASTSRSKKKISITMSGSNSTWLW